MRRRRALGLLGLLALLVAANVAAGSRFVQWDLTAERSATLSNTTVEIVEALDEPIEITAVFGRDHPGRAAAATLLGRYRRLNRHVRWRIVDPLLAPGELERLRGMVPGAAAVVPTRDPQRAEVAPLAIEIDLTSALARVIRGNTAVVCATTGHGERGLQDAGPEGLASFAQSLRDNGYTLRTIDLLAAPAVPEDCDAVLVADPTSAYAPEVVEALTASLRRSGKLFVMLDPDSTVDLNPAVSGWGIAFRRGIVFEADPASRLRDDPTAPIVRRYDPSNPTVRGIGPTYFPGAEAVEVTPLEGRPGLSVAPIARTSDDAVLETFAEGAEPASGPLALVAAADDSEVVDPSGPDPKIDRTRILAVGDVDFASNAFLGEAANARLALQGMDWLTQPEPLLTAVPNLAALRELELTEQRSRAILLLTAGGVPMAFLLAGAFVWVLRRGR